jgi:hypothetical protein
LSFRLRAGARFDGSFAKIIDTWRYSSVQSGRKRKEPTDEGSQIGRDRHSAALKKRILKALV